MTEIKNFIEGWGNESPKVKSMAKSMCDCLCNVPNLEFAYRGRPGISHSLRIGPGSDPDRPFFALIDVIDDEPEARWLSICMYADLVDDPKDLADPIPGGLDGNDAMCFDLDEDAEDTITYVLDVLVKASQKVKEKLKLV